MAKLKPEEFRILQNNLKQKLSNNGFHFQGTKPLNYGISLLFEDGKILNLYNGKKGASAVLAGKINQSERKLFEEAISAVLQKGPSTLKPKQSPGSFSSSAQRTPQQSSSSPSNLFSFDQTWVGCDESGKGDFFGPLVVCAVAFKPEQVEHFAQLGIQDGKKLSNARVHHYAHIIQDSLPYKVCSFFPEEYNRDYPGNLNHFLSDLHAQVIGELAQQEKITHAISDQFGNPARLRKTLRNKGPENLELISLPRAEQDIAVAAAGILARSLFLQALEELSNEAGQNLPPGAGPQVLAAGKTLVRSQGESSLRKYAKLHFKTREQILSATHKP